MIIENNKYFVDQVNSSKANQFTAYYHYSGVGFNKAILNLGVFNKETQQLVGVLQWGCSYQERIRLDRYVKEPIDKNEYLELNRFCMADSEGKNSESQAIGLGIKWIKRNRPDIRLLVSYAGRKEGNYGYIYQATNWEYLGHFISEGFWFLDGEERHLTTVWDRYKKHGDPNLSFIPGLCQMYKDVRKTWTKQFIYIQRLDKKLTPATDILPYPKPITDAPIKTKELIYQQDDIAFASYVKKEKKIPVFYYNPEELLFSRRVLIRRGELEKGKSPNRIPLIPIAVYDIGGHLESKWANINELKIDGYLRSGIRDALKTEKVYKNKYFRFYETEEPDEEIEVPIICIIDEIPFASLSEIGRYLGVSRQAVHQAKKRNSKVVAGANILWVYDE